MKHLEGLRSKMSEKKLTSDVIIKNIDLDNIDYLIVNCNRTSRLCNIFDDNPNAFGSNAELICYHDNNLAKYVYIDVMNITKNFKIIRGDTLFLYDKENGEHLYDKFTKSIGLEIDSLFRVKKFNLSDCLKLIKTSEICDYYKYLRFNRLYDIKIAKVDNEKLLFLYYNTD